MIVDGKQIADEILGAARTRVAELGRTPVVRAVTVSPNTATASYLRVKAARATDAGMTLEIKDLLATATTADVIRAVEEEGADAVIVQLPLPSEIDTQATLDAIPLHKDADVLSRAARAAFVANAAGALLPPVAGAVKEILKRANVDSRRKKAVVVGKGWLVGGPAAAWLTHAGADVTVLTRESGDIAPAIKNADIIVSGAGSPHLITPDMLAPGVVLIDAGTSESNGALAGDADPSCAEVASVFTPVPGGVGPVAVACLFSNAADLLRT
jgi:methylenetetrahydrofolate dehydrogenase (NADP+)/methenyltetrahydrofolate cyclohydrolase